MITASTLSNNMLTLVIDNGKQILTAPKSHPKWEEIMEAYRQNNEQSLLGLISMKAVVEKFSDGGLAVSDQGVFYKDMPLSGIDVDRIMAFLRENLPYEPIANYMVRKLANPSRRAIKEMYNFLEHKNMPLTPDGYIIAYKGVQKDFYSVSSGAEPLLRGRRNERGQIYNGIGEIIEMERSSVDDDFMMGCSQGLHAGSLEYARDWARDHNGIIILIKIDPANIVSVPLDCECKKCRCHKYEVLSVYDGPLPDTYTKDYSEEPDTISDTSSNSEEDDEMSTCDECREYVDECTCGADDNCSGCGLDCDCYSPKPKEEPLPEKQTPAENLRSEFDKFFGDLICKKMEKAKEDLNKFCQDTAPVPEKVKTDSIEFNIRQKMVEIICEQVGWDINNITDRTDFINDLGLDSLDMVELVMEVEQEFGIDVSDEIAENCKTVGDAIRALHGLLIPNTEPPTQPSPNVLDNLEEEGYKKGRRDGTRRRARLYRDGETDMNPSQQAYINGYNRGYRESRWDYYKK